MQNHTSNTIQHYLPFLFYVLNFKHFIIIISLIASAGCYAIDSEMVSQALDQLDDQLMLRDQYLSKRIARIDSIRNEIDKASSTEQLLDIYDKLGDEYHAFNNDSSLVYYTRGYDLAREKSLEPTATIFRIKRAVNLPLSGFMSDAVNELDDIDVSSLPKELLTLYYESGRQMCSYIASFYAGNASGDYWKERQKWFLDEYISLYPKDDEMYTINFATWLVDIGERAQALGLLEEYIQTIPKSSNLYARATHLLSTIAEEKGDTDTQTYYLALSAKADIESAVLEVTALQQLGHIMLHKGEINQAYEYLSTALKNAVECHASVRMIETSSVLPLLLQAHNKQIAKSKSRFYLVIVLLGIALLLMFGGLAYLRMQMKRTSDLKDRLESANQMKDFYISQFFRLSSIYVDKMNNLCRIVNRKISSGQTDDLYKLTKSNKFVEEQTMDFYRMFDDAFVNMYPGFVDKVNDLLADKIILKEGEILNNDLRLLAFMRLGLEDTNQVAQILNYSVNTIYAYRNKLRNRAIDRDNFEANIMRIPSI